MQMRGIVREKKMFFVSISAVAGGGESEYNESKGFSEAWHLRMKRHEMSDGTPVDGTRTKYNGGRKDWHGH